MNDEREKMLNIVDELTSDFEYNNLIGQIRDFAESEKELKDNIDILKSKCYFKIVDFMEDIYNDLFNEELCSNKYNTLYYAFLELEEAPVDAENIEDSIFNKEERSMEDLYFNKDVLKDWLNGEGIFSNRKILLKNPNITASYITEVVEHIKIKGKAAQDITINDVFDFTNTDNLQ